MDFLDQPNPFYTCVHVYLVFFIQCYYHIFTFLIIKYCNAKNESSLQYLIEMYINHCKNRLVDLTNPYMWSFSIQIIKNESNKYHTLSLLKYIDDRVWFMQLIAKAMKILFNISLVRPNNFSKMMLSLCVRTIACTLKERNLKIQTERFIIP